MTLLCGIEGGLMKIIDGSVYSKEELIEIINHILNAEYEFTKKHYMAVYQCDKKRKLLDEAHELVKKMKSLPCTQRGLLESVEVSKKIDAIHKRVDKIEKSILID